MAIQKTEAFILRTHPFRTSSLIVNTFTRSFGKIKGLAKGVRTEGVAQPSTYEPFNLLEMVFYEKIRSELHLISEATVIESFNPLRSDLEAMASAYYLAELVDLLTVPHDPHETIFDLLHFAFQFLPSLNSTLIIRFFEVRILHEIGLLPHLSNCLSCGNEKLEQVYFSFKQAAIFCPNCRKKAPESRLMGKGVFTAMRKFTEGGISEAAQHPLNGEVERQMGEVMERFLADRVGRRFLTRKFLNQVKAVKTRGRVPA